VAGRQAGGYPDLQLRSPGAEGAVTQGPAGTDTHPLSVYPHEDSKHRERVAPAGVVK
jgi:hypothetical protein